MAKMKLREIGMDPLERLYYERLEHRKKAYFARQHRILTKNGRGPVTACQINKHGISQAASAAI